MRLVAHCYTPFTLLHLRVLQGADAGCVNKEGLPALHEAVFNGHTDTVGSVMLRSEVRGSTQPCCVCVLQGADAGCVNKEGLPALHVAVFNGHTDAVAALVDDGGADVNVQGPTSGNTALHEAVLIGPSLSRIIDALLTYVSPESNTHTHTPV